MSVPLSAMGLLTMLCGVAAYGQYTNGSGAGVVMFTVLGVWCLWVGKKIHEGE